MLPPRYLHAVFTLPHELSRLALQNKRVVYPLLLRTSAETLLAVARDPQRLGTEIGFFSVLHTWNQKLQHQAPLRLLAVLDVLSSTPPLVKRRAPRTDGPRTHFASPRGEKAG